MVNNLVDAVTEICLNNRNKIVLVLVSYVSGFATVIPIRLFRCFRKQRVVEGVRCTVELFLSTGKLTIIGS